MSFFGVDTLGGLAEKLKQLVNDTQNIYESFIDATQLYKQGKMADREYFAKIGEYLVASSAMNFLAVRVILELKGALDKGTTLKNPTGGPAYSAASSPSQQQAGFGIGGFVGAGGSVGPGAAGGDVVLPSPSLEPSFRPVDIELPRHGSPSSSSSSYAAAGRPPAATKNCIICGTSIPQQAKFCSKCGRSQ